MIEKLLSNMTFSISDLLRDVEAAFHCCSTRRSENIHLAHRKKSGMDSFFK